MTLTRRGFGAGICATAAALPMITRADTGFHVPAEDERHEATFMQWPASLQVYEGDRWFLDQTQDTIAEIASTIAEFEPVILLADGSLHDKIRRRVSDRVTLWDVPTDDLWARDSCAVFARDGTGARRAMDLNFNGWGNRQRVRNDRKIARRVAAALDLPLVDSGVVGEGGGVEQDGHGLLIAHESSWVHRNRNPGRSRDQVEGDLLAAYGADRMIWAPGLKNQDITDYHIDSLAKFTGPGRVFMNLPDNPIPGEDFHETGIVTHDILAAAGLKIDVVPEPEFRRVSSNDFVASYANHYVCNGGVVCSQFGDTDTDQEAERVLRRTYPGREVVMLNADPLGEVGGGIHCATQQLPA